LVTKLNKYWKLDENKKEYIKKNGKYPMILFIIIFNKLRKLKKEKIKNVV
jgi:hypothetical protein